MAIYWYIMPLYWYIMAIIIVNKYTGIACIIRELYYYMHGMYYMVIIIGSNIDI